MMDRWWSSDMLFWISIGSGIALLVGAVTAPLVISKLPEDVFSNPGKPRWLDRQPAVVRIPLRILKNVLGLGLVVLGVAMLVLPGQGVLSILLGALLVDFPGKVKAQQWLLNRPRVMKSLNWLRAKLHRPAFKKPAKGRQAA
jgi:hypothetical protein